MLMEQFADTLSSLRKKKNITQAEIKEQLNIDPNYQRGLRPIDFKDVIRIADFLGLNDEERAQLYNSWRIDRYGIHVIRQWKLLDAFFSHYHIDRSDVRSFKFRTDIREKTDRYVFLSGELEVQQGILALMSRYADFGKPGITPGKEKILDSDEISDTRQDIPVIEKLREGMIPAADEGMFLVMQPDDSLAEDRIMDMINTYTLRNITDRQSQE